MSNVVETPIAVAGNQPAPNIPTINLHQPAAAPVTPAADPAPEEPKAPEKPEEKPPSPAEDPKFAARFAVLARKEKALTQREADFKRRSEESAAKLARAEELEQLIAKSKDNPLLLLDKAGLTYEQITRHILNDGKKPTEDQIEEVRKEIGTLRQEKEQEKKNAEAARLKAEDEYIKQAVDYYKNEVNDYIEKNPDDCQLIIAYDAQDDVFSVIETYFQETGELLDPKKAAAYVETELIEQGKKLLALPKFKPAEAKPTGENIQDTPKDVQDIPKPSRTLSNSQVTTTVTPSEDYSSMSREERMAKAAAMIRWISED